MWSQNGVEGTRRNLSALKWLTIWFVTCNRWHSITGACWDLTGVFLKEGISQATKLFHTGGCQAGNRSSMCQRQGCHFPCYMSISRFKILFWRYHFKIVRFCFNDHAVFFLKILWFIPESCLVLNNYSASAKWAFPVNGSSSVVEFWQ